jgi:DNA-binding NtrC family response regulator
VRPPGISSVELFADRFVATGRGGFLDLARGCRVDVRIAAVGTLADRLRWAERCAALAGLWHPNLVRLIDYGLVGSEHRFEAIDPVPERASRRRRALAGVRSAVAFIAESGLSSGQPSTARIVECDGCLLLDLDDTMGYPLDVEPAAEEARWQPIWGRSRPEPVDPIAAVVLQPRPSVTQIVEALECGGPPGVRAIDLHAYEGGGLRTALLLIAREARLRGYVPVAVDLVHRWRGLLRALAGRHVLLIDRAGRQGHGGASIASLTALGLTSLRSNVLLRASSGPDCPREAILLDPLPASALVRMVRTFPPRALSAQDVQEAARFAGGCPGVFLARLCHRYARVSRPRLSSPFFVAEAAMPYVAPSAGPKVVPADPGLVKAHERAARAESLVESGRHAAAERLFRSACAALERRGDRDRAARCALRLGELCRDRGRPREAIGAFQLARRAAPGSGLEVESAIRIGSARVDQGRLIEAEAVLRSALAAAGGLNARDLRVAASAALARMLYWQARYDEAGAVLAPLLADLSALASYETQLIAVHIQAGRLAVARRDLVAGGRHAAAAMDAALRLARPRPLAAAHTLMAVIHAALRDCEALQHHVRMGVVEARRAHAPLQALRLRLALADGLVRAGRAGPAARLAVRLARLSRARVPALLRARTLVVLAAALPEWPAAAAWRRELDRFLRASGACALMKPPREEPAMNVLQELAEVLRICHESEDDLAALGRVCANVRERVRASAVAVIGAPPHERPLSSAGLGWPGEPVAARRAIATGLDVPPARSACGLEAASPVRYGGQTIAALACRWPAAAEPDAPLAGALMSAAAAACAPSVRAALDRLSAPAVQPGVELLGVSTAIDAVRRAVARAAAAPFPVLIEGESGSGKELVARAVHRGGARRSARFCAINCAALTDELVEAELFGHARGAFTGALGERIGLFEEAHDGTLFLDEVSELSPRAQAKLLRTLQEGEIRRIGENVPRRVDVRVIAASNRPLASEAEAGRFRNDLRYRLDVIRIVVPPLRDRPEDIPVLARHFWASAIARTGSRATLDSEMLVALARYDWPGNVRELQNVLASLAVHAPRRGRIGPATLPDHIERSAAAPSASLEEARLAFERRFVRAALARAAGRRGLAAAELGLSRQGLTKLLRRLEIDDVQESVKAEAAGNE